MRSLITLMWFCEILFDRSFLSFSSQNSMSKIVSYFFKYVFQPFVRNIVVFCADLHLKMVKFIKRFKNHEVVLYVIGHSSAMWTSTAASASIPFRLQAFDGFEKDINIFDIQNAAHNKIITFISLSINRQTYFQIVSSLDSFFYFVTYIPQRLESSHV